MYLSIHGDSGCLFTCLLRKVTETEPWQRTHPVYFINFRKAHYFVVIMTIQK